MKWNLSRLLSSCTDNKTTWLAGACDPLIRKLWWHGLLLKKWVAKMPFKSEKQEAKSSCKSAPVTFANSTNFVIPNFAIFPPSKREAICSPRVDWITRLIIVSNCRSQFNWTFRWKSSGPTVNWWRKYRWSWNCVYFHPMSPLEQ